MRPPSALESLRAQVRQIEGQHRRATSVLPFGVAAVDSRLPGGGAAAAARCMRSQAAATARSTARPPRFSPPGSPPARAARCSGVITRPDLFAPALAQAGLNSDRVIYLEGGDEKTILACFEEGLRHGGLGAVVAEVARLPMTASRRLQLAAEGSGTIGIALRRWRRQTEAADFGQPTAATTRWRVSALPSTPLPVPGVGRPRWLVELIRCRAGESADFELEACDDTGRLRSSCRPCPPTGSGGRPATQRLRLRRR